MPIAELDRFRQKYPQYNDMDDTTLATKLAAKYPQYSDLVDKTQSTQVLDRPTTEVNIRRPISPEIGQIGGGLVGGFMGARVGRPYLGGIIGGVAGRQGIERLNLQLQKAPVKTAIRSALFPSMPIVGQAIPEAPITPEEQKALSKSGLITAGYETAGAGLAKGLTGLGRGVVKGLLGRRVAERGFESGWRKVLNPEFFKDRVPKEIAVKVNNFFDKLTNTTGGAIDDLINKKYAKTLIDIEPIKNAVRALIPKSGDVGDLLEMTAPKAQKQLLVDITNKIIRMGGLNRRVGTLWELRKTVDKAIYGKAWTPDAKRFLMAIRRLLNEPIKNVGDDVANAFSRYSFVKGAEDDLVAKFEALKGPEGELYSRKLESFVSELLSEKKDETIRLLKDLDILQNADDRVIETLLDYAASESLEKGLGMGVFQKILTGLLGGRKLPARIGQFIQARPVQIGARLGGRILPTALSSLSQEQ